MKILQIRFQNLNSLNGIWNIDFTASTYTEHNLFAITGPTGSGKSTLLDAICLALYGTTPRLGKITKSSNEIMSRHTAHCFAEVQFSTSKGIFRCHWSQHRSRHKTTGDLQAPKHEIVNAENNTILESKIRDVAIKVEEVTGMDFDRFTRSTLLAQGGFAAFLEASANERAPILEQITGTSIYSELSIKVHELLACEQQKLDELNQTISHINLLSKEDEKLLRISNTETEKELTSENAQLTNIQNQHTWLETISRLTAEKTTSFEKLEELRKKTKSKSDKLKLLAPALKARPIEPLYVELKKLRQNTESTAEKLIALKQKLQAFEAQEKSLKQFAKEAEQKLIQAEESRKTGLLLINDVQQLDHTILSTKETSHEQQKSLTTIQTSHKNVLSKIETLKQNLLKNQKTLARIEAYFKDRIYDADLVEQFGTIELQIATLEKKFSQYAESLTSKEDLLQKHKSATQIAADLTQQKERLLGKLTASKESSNHLQKNIDKLLQGNTSSVVQQALFQARNKQKSLQELLQLMDETQQEKEKLNTLQKDILHLTQQNNALQKQLLQATTDRTSKSQEITLLEKNLRLLEKIQTLEKERDNLQDNYPCPLCGSKDHPYTTGVTPQSSEEGKILSYAKTELLEISDKHTRLTREKIITEESLKNRLTQAKETDKHITKAKTHIQQLLSLLDLPSLAEIDIIELNNSKSRLDKHLVQLEADWIYLEENSAKLAKIAISQKKLEETEQIFGKSLLKAKHILATSEKDTQTASQQVEKASTELNTLNDDLSSQLLIHDIDHICEKNLVDIVKQLQQKVSTWKKQKEEEKQISPKIITLQSEITHNEHFCSTLTIQIDSTKEKHQAIQKNIALMCTKRTELFGNKETKKESKHLEDTVKKSRDTYQQLQKELTKLDKTRTVKETLYKHLSIEKNQLTVAMAEQEELFNAVVAQSAFSDSQQFLDARMSSQDLDILQKLSDELTSNKTELQALYKDKTITLQLERKKSLCKESIDELQVKLALQKKQINSLQEKTISIREQLKTHEADTIQHKHQVAFIETQKKTLGRWNRLHMLIGSADGKKFRNFAQGLTFEMMVHHANTHLNKMTDRYILLRDSKHPLELNVMDTYQADEIRSTKNLSGGESFLVSMALALGLSRMSSQNVRVDSLFLDEGFGTLDEEALDSALETLAGLRDENKLIGIISHMAALKERVPLQIEVIPGLRGKSSIKGPGVSMEIQ